MAVQLVWLKRDLRTTDHRPLVEAAAAGPVLPLYIAEPGYWAQPSTSARQWHAIAMALEEVSLRLDRLGCPVTIRIGDAVEVLAAIHAEHGIARLLAHEETGDDWTFQRDIAVRGFCRRHAIPMVEYPQFGVVRALRDRDRWGKAHAAFMQAPLIGEPHAIRCGAIHCRAMGSASQIPDASELGLAPDGCDRPQPGTRAEGLERLRSFLAGRGAQYRRAMSNPLEGETACSRLSVSLSTGSLSIREVITWCTAERRKLVALPSPARAIPVAAVDSLLSRLHWHCHFIQKLESQPALEFTSAHRAHQAARSTDHSRATILDAWAEGRTGFPFVDACMRSLVATGWLNFRMRAMVQAFATYHLDLDWHESATRLAALFTDYEPGIHWPQAQMQAGQTGINTPRIYNPVKQGLDQDPAGIFTRRWLPEMAEVPLALLQEPWRMDREEQRLAGCRIGIDYPSPLVDHLVAARAARERISVIRASPGYRQTSIAVYARHGSRARRIDEDHPPSTRAMLAARAAKKAAQLALDL